MTAATELHEVRIAHMKRPHLSTLHRWECICGLVADNWTPDLELAIDGGRVHVGSAMGVPA